MIIPLRKPPLFDSLPFSRSAIAAGAVVPNGATGLNIPDGTVIAAGNYYQTSTWILTEGYRRFSLVGWVTVNAPAEGVEVLAIPISAVTPSQQLDGVSFGTMQPGAYVRVSLELPNTYGFHLRLAPSGLAGGQIINILELQLSS